MARALELALRGLYTTHPNPRVGCVLVRDGELVGEGWHERAGEPHAEVLALRMAGERARGATAYVTLEPCCYVGRTGPCSKALIEAGIRRVVAAMQDPNPQVSGSGFSELKKAGIQVDVGFMQAEAAALNRGFISRMQRERPWVRLKLAMSLDGRTAAANGGSRWITGEAARADVHRLRAECGAVLTSAATVLADDPALTVRMFSPPPCGEGSGEGVVHQPDRIVLDSSLRTPLSAKILAGEGRKFLVTGATRKDVAAFAQRAPDDINVVLVPLLQEGKLNLEAALLGLGLYEINEVLIECGPRLAGALLQARLVDEFVLYVAPILLGDAAPGLAHLPDVRTLAQQLAFETTDVRAFGRDWRITAVPRMRQ